MKEECMDKDKLLSLLDFREPLDIALGVLGNEGELLIFHYDCRRFEPYKT